MISSNIRSNNENIKEKCIDTQNGLRLLFKSVLKYDNKN